MKNLIIIGAGGMGRSIYNLALECLGYGTEFGIKGFIDDNLFALSNYKGYPPIIGTIRDYQISEDDIFVNSVGDVNLKRKCVSSILNRGGVFINLIHPSAKVSTIVSMGKGCVIDRFVSIGADTSIGDFTILQNGTIVGHDVTIGEWSRLDCHVVLVGGVKIGKEVCIHTGAIINHDIIINDFATVGAGSFVIRNVKESSTVFGNPARILI